MRHSTVTEKNPNAKPLKGATNAEFFVSAGEALVEASQNNKSSILLFGGKDRVSCLVRQAQACLRWDLRASYWSHACLLVGALPTDEKSFEQAAVLECTLQPPNTAFQVPERNGVTVARLADFDEKKYPNVAVISFSLDSKEANEILSRATDPNIDRQRYDLWGMLGVWREYVWTGAKTNPLVAGVRMFNTAYCEMAYDAVGIDLIPGATETNSSPEHFWNTALWWWMQYSNMGHAITIHYIVREEGITPSLAYTPQIAEAEWAKFAAPAEVKAFGEPA